MNQYSPVRNLAVTQILQKRLFYQRGGQKDMAGKGILQTTSEKRTVLLEHH